MHKNIARPARSTWSRKAITGVLQSRSLRSAEWVEIAYFSYTAALTISRGLGSTHIFAAVIVPLLVWACAVFESANTRPASRVCRALLPTALILVAYRQTDWFTTARPLEHVQRTWAIWDREILTTWGLQHFIEILGPVGPCLLDASYLLLYIVPPLCVILLLTSGRGDRVDRFLTMLLVGTFAAYALLPHFPTLAPRTAFPGDLLPNFVTPLRRLNLLMLDHLDISRSVFPSGHVAVAGSSAFGILLALPERRWPAYALGIYALLVFCATIYGRYHYAADGSASIALVLAFGAGVNTTIGLPSDSAG